MTLAQTNSIRPSKSQVLSVFLLLTYFIVRFPLLARLDEIGPYASYVFELVYALLVLALFAKQISFKVRLSRQLALDSAIALASGLAIYKMAAPLGLMIPFDLRSTETILFLLIVAPVLEELIFRMAHWQLLSELYRKPAFILLTTSALFSFSHFFSWWSVPDELKSFVLYQTAYTFLLALYCGTRRMQTNTVTVPIFMHFFFNAGFFLGSFS